MNKVVLIGRLTRDPELRTIPNGTPTATFTLAVNRTYTNQSGEREADFLNVVTWRRLAENVSKYCSKGSQVAVEGRIQTRSYDAQDGSRRYITEIIADNVEFLSSRENSSANYPSGSSHDYSSNSYQTSDYQQSVDRQTINSSDVATTDISEDPFKDFGKEVVLSDDDLPF